VHLHHQRRRLDPVVAEQLLEDVGDVAHQVDRVVPDDRDPRPVGRDALVDVGTDDALGGRARHALIVA
jgi:hypothetical protein